MKWRRGRDSNPRSRFLPGQPLSKRTRSATPAPLRGVFRGRGGVAFYEPWVDESQRPSRNGPRRGSDGERPGRGGRSLRRRGRGRRPRRGRWPGKSACRASFERVVSGGFRKTVNPNGCRAEVLQQPAPYGVPENRARYGEVEEREPPVAVRARASPESPTHGAIARSGNGTEDDGEEGPEHRTRLCRVTGWLTSEKIDHESGARAVIPR